METSTHLPSKTFSRIAIGLFAMALSAIGLQFLLGFLQAALVFNHVAIPNWAIWLMTSLPMYCVGFPIGFWVMKKVPCEVKEKTAIGGKEFFQLLIMCLPMMYAGNIIGTLLSMLLSGGQATNALDIYLFDDSPLKVLVVVIVAPMLEELMFRKQIIDRCGKYGEKTAILFSATMFALFHMNLFQCFYAFRHRSDPWLCIYPYTLPALFHPYAYDHQLYGWSHCAAAVVFDRPGSVERRCR